VPLNIGLLTPPIFTLHSCSLVCPCILTLPTLSIFEVLMLLSFPYISLFSSFFSGPAFRITCLLPTELLYCDVCTCLRAFPIFYVWTSINFVNVRNIISLTWLRVHDKLFFLSAPSYLSPLDHQNKQCPKNSPNQVDAEQKD
jgi:hypothetical protein